MLQLPDIKPPHSRPETPLLKLFVGCSVTVLCRPDRGAAEHECCMVDGGVREGEAGDVLQVYTALSVTSSMGPGQARSSRGKLVTEQGKVIESLVIGVLVMVMLVLAICCWGLLVSMVTTVGPDTDWFSLSCFW